jgi:hypothetical protein
MYTISSWFLWLGLRLMPSGIEKRLVTGLVARSKRLSRPRTKGNLQ